MRKINLQAVPAYPASPLADLMRAIVDFFGTVEPTTTIFVGERYLKQEGKPRRIVLVPETGNFSGVLGVGEGSIGGLTMACTAYLWGAETASDLDRYDDATSLLHRFANVLKRIAGSRVKDAPIDRERGTNIETFGEEYQFRFSYEYGVPVDTEVWNYAIPAPSDPQLSPPPYNAPPGTPASTIAIDITVTPEEP